MSLECRESEIGSDPRFASGAGCQAGRPCFLGVFVKAKRNGYFVRCHWESVAPRPPVYVYGQEGPVQSPCHPLLSRVYRTFTAQRRICLASRCLTEKCLTESERVDKCALARPDGQQSCLSDRHLARSLTLGFM